MIQDTHIVTKIAI